MEGLTNGMDLVRQMQLKGDLENAWIMFDQIKHVEKQTTMACHVYDLMYCKVMTITTCDMQSNNTNV
jgi:hypothetical protein